MSETTNITPEDLIHMLQKAKRQGAYETLNWLCWELDGKKDATPKDILTLIHSAIGAIGEELYNDFRAGCHIFEDLERIIEDRKKREKETGTE